MLWDDWCRCCQQRETDVLESLLKRLPGLGFVCLEETCSSRLIMVGRL